MAKNHKIYLAPLRGFTERPFRDAFSEHFHGVDAILAPFIPLVTVDYVNPSRLKDILPNDEHLPLIPQVIGNDADQIIQMAEVFESYGYDEINWNLGCPMPKITHKNRGSGLLRYPEKIHSILTEVFDHVDIKVSVKTRLGFADNTAFEELVNVFNDFPLTSLTVHTRTGAQMYTGKADPDFFAPYIEKINVKEIIYNGDIFTIDDFYTLKKQMPDISSWMIGRGLLGNPFLGEWIQSGNCEFSKERFLAFHYTLFQNISQSSASSRIILNRMKGYWTQFRHMYSDHENIRNCIFRSQDVDDLMVQAEKIIKYAAMK